MLATTAIGAVWSSAAPEFGAGTVIDRFSQLEPKLVFVADGYRYGGKNFDRRGDIAAIIAALPSVETVVWMDYLDADGSVPSMRPPVLRWDDALSGPPVSAAEFQFEHVPFDHPLWVLFSSGTTGLPKAIVHGHLGILLEHYKSAAFHMNIKPGRSVYFYTTTGWMVWNTLMWGPLMNGIAVLYDGDPAFPRADSVWEIASRTKAQQIGISPTLVLTMQKLGIRPRELYDLSALEGIFLVGSPATPESFAWLYENVKSELWVTSQSGGTEFCSGLVGGSPTLPVHAGEIQARTLGADIISLDDAGNEVIGEPGELVIRSPMPSMPIQLWGDTDFTAYRAAYFDVYPDLWRHGDSFTLNARGACFVHGRSDATLNRYGVRIGSAEIYRTLDAMPELADSLVICIEDKAGGFYMPLFVQMRDSAQFDDDLVARIRQRLRSERSPRHVPDEIIAVPAIPYTLTSKKMEVPVRKLLMGVAPEKAASSGSMRDPRALDWFAAFAAKRIAG
jgi:acetoacetyl-CoA synthetase